MINRLVFIISHMPAIIYSTVNVFNIEGTDKKPVPCEPTTCVKGSSGEVPVRRASLPRLPRTLWRLIERYRAGPARWCLSSPEPPRVYPIPVSNKSPLENSPLSSHVLLGLPLVSVPIAPFHLGFHRPSGSINQSSHCACSANALT